MQIGQPSRIVDVGLAARHRLDMPGVRQRQLEHTVGQDVPDRLPVNTSRFHDHMRTALRGKPVRQGEKVPSRCLERSDLVPGLALGSDPNTCYHHVFVDIQAGTALMQDFHHSLLVAPSAGRSRR
jgi:hypothetical protein